MYKYYTYNVTYSGQYVGSRVLRVWAWVSPLAAMVMATETLTFDKAVVDFKRIK